MKLPLQTSRFSSQVFLTLTTTVLLQTVGLLTGIMAARLLGPAGRGELAAIQTWGAFIATIALVGLPDAVVYFSGRHPGQAGRYWASGTSFALITGLPVLLAGYWGLPWILRAQSPVVISVARWYALGLFLLSSLSWMPLSTLRGLRQFTTWNILRTLPNLGWLLVLFLAVISQSSSLHFLVMGFLISYAVVSLPLLATAARVVPGPYYPSIGLWPTMVKYSLPLMASALPNQLLHSGRLSQLFIAAFLEPSALGLYVVGVAWSRVTGIVPSAIAAVVFPRVAAASCQRQAIVELARGTRMTVLSIVGVSAMTLILCTFATPVLFGKDFAPAIPAALLMVIAGSADGLKRVLGDGLRGLGKSKSVLMGELVAVALTGLLLPLLVRPFSIIGAAIAMLVGNIGGVFLLSLRIARVTNSSMRVLVIPTSQDFRSLASLFQRIWAWVGK